MRSLIPFRWNYFDASGAVRHYALDKDRDGMPDEWRYKEGRGRFLREHDRNRDGKVDERRLTAMIYDNRVGFSRHVNLWREADTDYDGIIDDYRVRGEKNPVPDRRGSPMDPAPKVYRGTSRAGRAATPSGADLIQAIEDRERLIRESREKANDYPN